MIWGWNDKGMPRINWMKTNGADIKDTAQTPTRGKPGGRWSTSGSGIMGMPTSSETDPAAEEPAGTVTDS